ncbi:hypothetical protein EON65_40175 [archaeon]|nr:MAG: hypothetical protein EON65_40175 [archaeon]
MLTLGTRIVRRSKGNVGRNTTDSNSKHSHKTLPMSSNNDQDETLPLDEIYAGFGSPVSSQRPPLPGNMVHSSPMVVLSSQRERGTAQWSQASHGTPIRT